MSSDLLQLLASPEVSFALSSVVSSRVGASVVLLASAKRSKPRLEPLPEELGLGPRILAAAQACPTMRGCMSQKREGEERARMKISSIQILERVGEGGRAIAYRGRQECIGHDVAVKLLRKTAADFMRRAKREPNALAGISTPHIVGSCQAAFAFRAMKLIDSASPA